jgi:MutS domain V
MKDQSPIPIYREQIRQQKTQLDLLKKKRNLLGWLRLIVFIATAIGSFKIFIAFGPAGLIPLLTGIALFIYLIFIDADNNKKIKNTITLIDINEEELKILDNNFLHRNDGSHFSPTSHNYANDLDLFGKASIFQWANRCFTEQGQNRFAENLLHSLPVHEIMERQKAVEELSPMLAWRQQLQSFSEQTTITRATEQKTEDWLQQEEKHFTGPPWKIIVWIYSIITVSSLLATIVGLIPGSVFLSLFALYFTISVILSRNTVKPYLQLTRIVEQITILEQLISWIETKNFHSDLLRQIQETIKSENKKASVRLRELNSILDKFDLRLSMIGPLFLNSFLLWDVRQMISLNEWRKNNQHIVPKLFEAIAEMEVLNSLSCIRFNYPDWFFPKFAEKYIVFHTSEIGHPLIPQNERVTNDFDIEGNTLISLVTGSNMAGKSTFLRSIGVNVVLAQMGAPVCAGSFTLSPVCLMSSMRINDNLAENTSTFYAELKKLKTIIEAVNRGDNVFVLLDEILRGTNSHDRHTGSVAFIKQLIRQRAFCVLATHDLELATLEKQYPSSIKNFHFDVQVKGEELYFDYKLKYGICQSLNASLLMKKIGIELAE